MGEPFSLWVTPVREGDWGQGDLQDQMRLWLFHGGDCVLILHSTTGFSIAVLSGGVRVGAAGRKTKASVLSS